MSRDIYAIPNIGALLRERRLARGLKQADVADEARITQPTLSLVERGADVRMSTVMAIAGALDLEVMLVPAHARPLIEEVIGSLPT